MSEFEWLSDRLRVVEGNSHGRGHESLPIWKPGRTPIRSTNYNGNKRYPQDFIEVAVVRDGVLELTQDYFDT